MRILKTIIIGLLIAWGIVALVGRILTPQIGDYRDTFAGLAAERLGTQVRIGSMQARWYGLRPVLELGDVTLGTAPFDLRVKRAELDLAPLELLRGRWADAVRLTITGLQLTAVREESGQVHLEGLADGQAGDADVAGGGVALPARLRLVDTRVIWVDRKFNRPPIPIDDIDINLVRDSSHLQIGASLETPAGNIRLAARLRGSLRGTDWSGESFVETDGLDAARLLAAYLPQHYGLDRARLSLNGWTWWQDAVPTHSQGRVELREVALRPAQGEALDLEQLAADFSLAHRDGGLQLGLRDLALQMDGPAWPRSDLAFEFARDSQGLVTVDLTAGYLRIEDVVRLLAVRPPDPALAQTLAALAPRGEVRDLQLRARRSGEQIAWRARSELRGFSSQPWQHLPGLDNFDASILVDDGRLQLQLASSNSSIDFPGLFRAPLSLQQLQGRVDLVRNEHGWLVESRELLADSPHISTRSRLRLQLREQHAPLIDLQTDFHDGDAAFAHHYYPAGIMSPALVAWLDRSIVSGRVTSGSALLHGALDEFAWERSRSGSFQVVFDTADLRLDYRAGWPAIDALQAHVKFHGNQLDIHARDGTIYDTRLDQVHARIASLHPITPIRIQGGVKGPLGDMLRVLDEDALRDRFGHFGKILQGEGMATLALDFRLPLGSRGSTLLHGRLDLDGNRLLLPDWDFALEAIDGQLRFSLDGLRAEDIRARALRTPLTIDVETRADGTTQIQARGRPNADTVLARLGWVPAKLVRGAADAQVRVSVPPPSAGADQPVLLAIDSGLRGITIDLPPPFGKQAAERRDLALAIPLTDQGGIGSLRYGNEVAARFSSDGRRIDVNLGGGDATLRNDRGVRIGGRLRSVDIGDWQATVAHLGNGGTTDATPLALNLSIDRLLYDTLRLDQVQLDAQRGDDAWRGVVHAANLAGRFAVPVRPGRSRIRIELERLALRLPHDDGTEGAPPPDPTTGPDPRTLAGLSLNVADLRLNDAALGRLEVRALAVDSGLEITRLALSGGQLTLDAAGHWSVENGRYRSQIGGRVDAPDLGQLLVDLGYSRQLVDAKADSEFLLGWPGNPAQLHRKTLAGKLDIEVGNGRLLELDPGVTRVVGLLNLNALTRRLRLDFSDFYKKGYSFDSITGSFVFKQGIAETGNLSMAGPTGRIDIRGRTDLVAETLDQKVAVTPSLDATLPIAGTIAGGPVAGLAVLVAQKVMTKQVDELNRFDYAVKGPWANPEITQLESGGTLSKLLRPFSNTPKASDALPAGETGTEAAASTVTESTQAPATEEPATAQEQAVQDPDEAAKPLRRLIDFFKSGESHGSDIPGAGN
ncbi:MAG: TIGR02099 family protein [Gammaproteobacteria bacterium]|nr:TIGR02099 family protein [Gammaproteobacteria bacterium]